MIPSWTAAGVLPPIRPGQPGHSSDRSPYRVALTDFVEEFSSSPERIAILNGFLDYRKALHALGITSGFQWIDGSFLENIEVIETRPPKDVDVVTYFYLPPGDTQASLDTKAGNLFDHDHVKATYKVDSYTSILGKQVDAIQVRKISYWYSMWSHRRDSLWKGFIQVDLDPQYDGDAKNTLDAKVGGGVTP
jgi:hypothetical protein